MTQYDYTEAEGAAAAVNSWEWLSLTPPKTITISRCLQQRVSGECFKFDTAMLAPGSQITDHCCISCQLSCNNQSQLETISASLSLAAEVCYEDHFQFHQLSSVWWGGGRVSSVQQWEWARLRPEDTGLDINTQTGPHHRPGKLTLNAVVSFVAI